MRVIRISLSLWIDTQWRANFRRSWKRRRYWIAKPEYTAIAGHPAALQFGPLTVKIIVEGKDHG